VQSLQTLYILLKKDIALEWRNKFTLGGLLLYVCSTVFVIYMAFNSVKPTTWLTLFWIVALFTISNAASRSFVNDFGKQNLFYYQLVAPLPFIFAKIIFNILIVWGVTALAVALFSVLLGYPMASTSIFLMAVLQGTAILTVIFTFISAIAQKAGNASFLLPVLSFPVIIPIVGLLIGITADAVTGELGANFWRHNQIIWAVTALTLALVWVLFPYLWKE